MNLYVYIKTFFSWWTKPSQCGKGNGMEIKTSDMSSYSKTKNNHGFTTELIPMDVDDTFIDNYCTYIYSVC